MDPITQEEEFKKKQKEIEKLKEIEKTALNALKDEFDKNGLQTVELLSNLASLALSIRCLDNDALLSDIKRKVEEIAEILSRKRSKND